MIAERRPTRAANAPISVSRLKRLYPVRLAKAYSESEAGSYAAGLAFNTFMSMFPLILGLLAVLGLVIHDAAAQARLEAGVLGFFPSDARGAVRSTLTGAREHAGVLGVVAVAGMFWSGSSLFTAMEWVLGRILGAPRRGFVRQHLMALSMTLVFTVTIVLAVGVNTVMGMSDGLPYAGPVAGVLIWTTFIVVIYRFVPSRTLRLGKLWRGAVMAGVLMEALSLLWPLFTRVSHGFNSYGSTFALFFVLATWLYLLSQLILLGAVVNRMRLPRPDADGLLAEAAGS